MPQFIRKALLEEMLSSREVREMLDDLALAGSVSLRFMTALGEEVFRSGAVVSPELCCWMGATTVRGRVCARVIQETMQTAAASGSAAVVCPAGLWEAAVPVWMNGEILGYLQLGQVAEGAAETTHINHWRHVLEREGAEFERERLVPLRSAVPQVDRARFAALVRLARTTASQMAALLERSLSVKMPQRRFPGSIHRALAYIRAHFDQPLALADLARETGLSRQHFCSLFHRSTGLSFKHYLNRVRIEDACRRLTDSADSITAIAFAAGFQSVSQFNRVFRQIRRCSPRQYRRIRGLT